MKSRIIKLFILALSVGFVACETMPDAEVKYASTYPISGEYWVQYSHIDDLGDNTFPFGSDFHELYIYNTAANNGAEVWITDDPNADNKGNFWEYRAKITCNPGASAFGLAPADSVVNDVYGYAINIGVYNGKIMKLASKQPSGAMADSISFDLILGDSGALSAAGDTIKVRGFRKTGFTEDGH